jgi:DNA invertase Pin-like site-specific DNA recombinase
MMACYCRVSTRRQKTDSPKADIQCWLTGHAVPPAVVQGFEDVESGTTLTRPAFDRMQQGIFMGTITTVVVWQLDRISRRQREGVHLLADWCERGVRGVAITQQLDLSGAVGRLVARVLFGLAEMEHEERRERQAAGIAVAKRQGRYHGRVKGTTNAQPARAWLLYERGCTVAEIRQALQISPRTVDRYLATEEKA